MLIAATIAILVVMALTIIRGCIGPTLYDRILAVNMFGTKTVLLISLLGFVMGRPEFLDIAIIYALINFISVIGVLRFSDSFGGKQFRREKELEKEE
ncbi:Na(+) H(+) antiporter subunit F [hydrothermal vent metagenome]|uniref:Na(+) H(+) antiporter subunit F n=1 Tax=hydrothermal vent metagenome TaxID=652676 RepID=A0A3B0RJD9_9ZZZZ